MVKADPLRNTTPSEMSVSGALNRLASPDHILPDRKIARVREFIGSVLEPARECEKSPGEGRGLLHDRSGWEPAGPK